MSFVIMLHGCAWWDLKQRQWVFRPSPGQPAEFALRPGDVSYALAVPGATPGTPDRLQLWWMPQADPQAPTLLYLHGTFRALYRNLPKIDALRDAGFSVLAVDYRGWGESTPLIPSEATILADAETAWTELVKHQPDPRLRVIFGHSMGGGVAVDLASRKQGGRDYGGLVLESTFTRLPDVAAAFGVLGTMVSWLANEDFDSVDKIGRIDVPILIMHGSADDTVPVSLGRALRDAAPAGTRWVEFSGGSHSRLHDDDPALYREAVKSLIARLKPAASASVSPPASP
ncbi:MULTISPECIES: alpha/beta hydrolase [unclassified Rhizobacter]|uniref:alpha/beta hydrolase n=1 Tax=unclassified Rhizobacter TaxID=2640088 RepID=UPI0006F67BA3|nr:MULTISPECIES: alpha/beta fold hydrolase [unclassified Rhizobacter]KQU74940.1 hypothetical protein ASC88_26370 [Rhizobacter sp. Root29]KQW00985.1 hypothetical protein ASC98_06595 [Rhizobacter sp. Root1238]KRB03835.1 hypothetical protein ASE08_14100 [Rhizobacter sp. Root16D2]